MNDSLHVIREHLQNHYPALPPLSDGNPLFWDSFTSEGLGRSLRQILDHNLRQVLYVNGLELLGFSPNQWSLEVCLGLIPVAYGKIYIRIAEAAYKLFFNHKLDRYGTSLRLESDIPIKDFLGNFHRVTRSSWCPVSNSTSNVILTATEFAFHRQWDMKQPAIEFRPTLFNGKKSLIDIENQLISIALEGFIENDLGLEKEWLPVFYAHLKGMPNNQIAQETGYPITKVNYYNTEILKIFHSNFSEDFKTAGGCAEYWNRQTLPR